jgi:hypothetical protein
VVINNRSFARSFVHSFIALSKSKHCLLEFEALFFLFHSYIEDWSIDLFWVLIKKKEWSQWRSEWMLQDPITLTTIHPLSRLFFFPPLPDVFTTSKIEGKSIIECGSSTTNGEGSCPRLYQSRIQPKDVASIEIGQKQTSKDWSTHRQIKKSYMYVRNGSDARHCRFLFKQATI